VDGKTAIVNLNYTHEENVFTLWRSLRFGDNLQAWLEQNTALPDYYQTVMAYKVSEVIAAIRAAGIRIKGE
ncbi:YdbH domain-containing protein, partial [Salmonella enterica subsp. enterica serovar Anatum]|nr:YdbH domain-containing protein [Salmonella enterica subsp. enterica serovar Anatum]